MFVDSSILNMFTGDSGTAVVNAEQITGGAHWDPGLRRPYRDDNGQVWYDLYIGKEVAKDAKGETIRNEAGEIGYRRKYKSITHQEALMRGLPVMQVNNATTMRKDSWIQLDQEVLSAFRLELTAWSDLRAFSTYGGFDGMATPILEYEAVTDIGRAEVDMEGLAEGRNFQPSYELRGLPLPITYAGFWMSERFLAASRNRGQGADTLRGEQAGRRVGELIENTTIGTNVGVTYGDSTRYLKADGSSVVSKVYGYTNHPDRMTYTTLTAAASVTAEGLYNSVIAMIQQSYLNGVMGPFMMYVSPTYDAILDRLFKTDTSLYPTIGTIRQALKNINGIIDVKRLNYLTGDVILLVQMKGKMVQAVNGLELTTVQWDTKGGAQHNFKVMCIQVPRIRSAFKATTTGGSTTRVAPIIHGTTS